LISSPFLFKIQPLLIFIPLSGPETAMKNHEIWKKARENLRSSMPAKIFDTWLSKASMVRMQAGEVVLQVPNKFVAAWLKERYLGAIERAFTTFLPKPPKIRFHIPAPGTDCAPPPTHLPQRRSKPIDPEQGTHPDFRFSSLVVGDHNRLAYSSALQVASSPGTTYNPFLIWGKTSCGKTHLLHAIANFVLETGKPINTTYLSADKFSAQISTAAKTGNLDQLKNMFARADILLFDDAQHLSDRPRSQEIFQWLFDALLSRKKQIVVASRVLPQLVPRLASPLQSRLTSGLMAEIATPDSKTKAQIIKNSAQRQKFTIPEDVAFYLAGRNDDIKVLLEDLVRLQANISIYHTNLDISTVKSLLEGNRPGRCPAIADILRITAAYFNLSLADILSNKKTRTLSYPRHLAMYLCRKHTGRPLKEIGRAFGRKDHSTVIYAVKRIESQIRNRKEVQRDLSQLEHLLMP